MAVSLFPFDMCFGLPPSNRSAGTFRTFLDVPLSPALKSQYRSKARRVLLLNSLRQKLPITRFPIKIKLWGG